MLVTFVTGSKTPMPQVRPHHETCSTKRISGFSLVEALVVVMIILIIVAIAIPSFVQARMKANEASAVSSMRVIQSAELMYSQLYPDIGFSKNLHDMGANGTDCHTPSATNACLIMDDNLANGFKSGYFFDVAGDPQKPSTGYSVNGTPEVAGISGRCSFSSDQTGEIMATVVGGATASRFSIGESGGGCGH